MRFRLYAIAFLILAVLAGCSGAQELTVKAHRTTPTLPVAGIDSVSDAPVPRAFAFKLAPIAADTRSSDASEVKLGCSVSVTGTWRQNSLFCSQIKAVIINSGALPVDGWSVTIALPAGSKLSEAWQGQFLLNGTMLTVSNMQYNGKLSPGSSAEFGFIVKSPAKIESLEASASPVPSNQYALPSYSNEIKLSAGLPISSATVPPKAPSMSGTLSPARPKIESAQYVNDDDWLFAKGNRIVDKAGKEVWLTGINWFGYNTGTNTFDGLWAANLEESLHSIAARGFNILRVPISAELIKSWSGGIYPRANYNAAVQSFGNRNSLQIFDYAVDTCQREGLKIMLDIHSANSDPMGHNFPLWYTSKVTADDYFAALAWIADRYKGNDTIVAIDLKNEPHGAAGDKDKAVWNDSTDKNNWKRAAETAANAVLSKNPNLLIVIEGIEIYPKNVPKNGKYLSRNPTDYYYNWRGGNLRGVRDYPVNLGKFQDKLVYSPHDYGPSVHVQPWFFSGFNYETLYRDCWRDNWMFIHENGTAPLLIGEWGGYMTQPDLTWMTHLRTLIEKNRISHTFWCFNANSGDTGGLVKNDFKTWDEAKYDFVKPVLWQKDGKFVGLDHVIPLGGK